MDLYGLLDHVIDIVRSDCTETVLKNTAKEGHVVAAQIGTEEGREKVFLLRAPNDTNKTQGVLDFSSGRSTICLSTLG